MIKAIIVDCFGVVIGDALSAMCAAMNPQDPVAIERIWALISQANKGEKSSEEASHEIAGIFGLSYEAYRQQLDAGEVKDMVLLDYIQTLRAHYKTAMLSNVPRGSLGRRFISGELERSFDVVVASGDEGSAKPEARVYEITAERLDVLPSECIFADDKQEYCDGAAAIGMSTILYTTYTQFRTDLAALLA